VRVCVRACVRVRVCVRACMCVRVCACVCARLWKCERARKLCWAVGGSVCAAYCVRAVLWYVYDRRSACRGIARRCKAKECVATCCICCIHCAQWRLQRSPSCSSSSAALPTLHAHRRSPRTRSYPSRVSAVKSVGFGSVGGLFAFVGSYPSLLACPEEVSESRAAVQWCSVLQHVVLRRTLSQHVTLSCAPTDSSLLCTMYAAVFGLPCLVRRPQCGVRNVCCRLPCCEHCAHQALRDWLRWL
jgi:hypothetical protein